MSTVSELEHKQGTITPHAVDAFKHSDTEGEASHIHRIASRLLFGGRSQTRSVLPGVRRGSYALVAIFRHNLQHSLCQAVFQEPKKVHYLRQPRRQILQYLATHG